MEKTVPQTIDDYIAGFPDDIQALLQQIRTTVREVAPDAQETIKYAMPTFMLHGRNLVYFSAFKNHIGFFPAPSGADEFKNELARHETGSGTLRFSYAEPIPYDLIRRVVNYWAERNLEKAAAKKRR